MCHTVKHGLSHSSTDCRVKLSGDLFNDSDVMKKIQLGPTKAEMITMNVLGPKTVRDTLDDLSEGEPVYFSVATDASNEGNRKCFLCV